MRVFFDCEFTGLHQATTLIGLGCVTEEGREFYAELTDYDRHQVDDWIQAHVIDKLHLRDLQTSERGFEDHSQYPRLVQAKGDREYVRMAFGSWLADFDRVEMWGDVLAYDWMLICDLFGGAMRMPGNIFYIPFDVATALALAGIDPDIDRRVFSWDGIEGQPHNALFDALLSKQAYIAAVDRIRIQVR